MAIFGGNRKEKKAEEYLQARGIDNLDQSYYQQVGRITDEMAGTGLMKAGLALSFANAEEQAKLGYLSALVEQNWVLIRQQDEILKELKKLNSK